MTPAERDQARRDLRGTRIATALHVVSVVWTWALVVAAEHRPRPSMERAWPKAF